WPFTAFDEHVDDVTAEEACCTGDEDGHDVLRVLGSDPIASALRTSSRMAFSDASALIVISSPVNGCEKRNIAPTPARLTPKMPEKMRSPISSLLPRCAGGVGKM